MDVPANSAMTALPAMVTEHVIGEDRLRQRGAVLTGEALADWTLLAPAGRGAAVSGLPGKIVLLDGLRLTPAADGQVDLSLLPLAWLVAADLSAGPSGAAHGAGSLGGTLDLSLAAAGSGNRAWAVGGAQSGRGIGGLDVRLGDDFGWFSAGFTQGGALATPAGLAATGQGRWHLGGRFAQDVGGATLAGRALLATRRDGAEQGDYHDLALQLHGGDRWRWHMAVATGAHHTAADSSRQTLVVAGISRETGLVLPGAVQPIAIAFGGEARQLRLNVADIRTREVHAETAVPLLQDRPGAEDLRLELGWRQAWLAGRSEPLWSARARWEFFPGLALRGGVSRGIDDLATQSGVARSIGLHAAPAFVPGFVATIDWRSQTAGEARVEALDVAVYLRRRIGDTAQLTLEAQATQHARADFTPLPVARFQSVLRARVADGGWALLAGWRHRSSLAGEPARHRLDLGIERQLSERIRLVASLGNAGDAGSAAGPVGRQALLQLVAGF
jgi:hypothetical protein